MTFASRITRAPAPFDPDRGDEALARLPDMAPELAAVIRGAAGCSPYLAGLIGHEADWIAPALAGPPEAALEDALRLDADADAEPALRSALRRAKRRLALLAGLADLGGVWELEEVTGALTRLADLATGRALGFQIGREIARGKLPGQGPDDIATAGGAVALAMGKMGAHELNYSSDIDLIVLFDDGRYGAADFHRARAALIRATRRMVAMLSEQTHEGYVFRTDLRLRPDPAVTPVCISMEAAERYYESLGRSWERAAFIKARPAAGDLAAGAGFLTRLAPFIWRRYLDFAAIQDAHDIRLAIRSHKGLGGPIALPGHDLKLGRGGIREIEFFTQTRQLIAGGRDPDLRQPDTLGALAALAAKGWVPAEAADRLAAHYRFLRLVEHRLQMIADAQTHKLPGDGAGFARLAMLMGREEAGLRRKLRQLLEEVHELTEGFFAPDGPTGRARPAPAAPPGSDEITARWPSYPALRSERARALFARLSPELLSRLAAADRPREALVAFDGFLKGLPAGVQVFSLFQANPQLVDLIVDIAATAPELAAYLGRHSAVFDAVIGGDFFSPWPGQARLAAELGARLGAVPDYEAALAEARRWRAEWHFRIGVHHLRGLIGAEEAGGQYADLAGAVLAALWPVVVAEFSRKHGAPPGRGAVVLGMGSLGGRRMHARSDLDLIVIYDPAGQAASRGGRRPLASRPYYARLTQALVTALSAPMADGRLYQVDMRLRPSGRQGPVATALEAFEQYQKHEAWTWEHMALSRARVVAGPEDLGRAVSAVRRAVLAAPRPSEKVLADLADMRRSIAEAASGAEGALEVRSGPGRMLDIELLAQSAALFGADQAADPATDIPAQIAHGAAIGWFSAADAAALSEAYRLFWRVRAAARLLTESPLEAEKVGQGGLGFVLREAGAGSQAQLARRIGQAADRAARIVAAVLAGPGGGTRGETGGGTGAGTGGETGGETGGGRPGQVPENRERKENRDG